MADALKMPDPLSSLSVQRNQTIGKKVVANAIRSIKVECGRAGGYVEDARLGIESHACPVVGAPAGLPRCSGPGVIAVFARMRNRVEAPAELACANLVSANVTRRSWQCLGFATADEKQVFVNQWRAGQKNRNCRRITSEMLAQIDPAMVTKVGDGLSCLRVQRIHEVHNTHENATISAILPVCESPIGLCSCNARVEFPFQCPGGGVQRKYLLRRCYPKQNAAYNNGTRLQAACFLTVERPDGLELFHVRTIDLQQRRIVGARARTSIDRPVPISRA